MVKFDWQAILTSRVLWIAIACIAALMLFGWLISGVDSCNFNRGITKKKEAVNATLEDIKQVEANINAEQKKKQELLANVKRDADAYLEAQSASDAAKTQTNAAIERMQQAANANRGNVNAAELEELLRGL